MKEYRFSFVMDIGTEPGDFNARYTILANTNNGSVPAFIHFSAGLWPSRSSIESQDTALAALEADILAILAKGQQYAAVGECGIDRHWNGVNGSAGGCPDCEQEEVLFKKQLLLAKRHNLAVIIHSRDGFLPTLRCIDEVGWHKGVIHCFSYGIEEAKQFIERGWYISVPGTITYAKTKEEIERIRTLMMSIPRNKLLLETDAPYLSPVPIRKEINTPLAIEYTYAAACTYLDCSLETLCETVYQNCRTVFSVK